MCHVYDLCHCQKTLGFARIQQEGDSRKKKTIKK